MNGYVYHKREKKNGKLYWRCALARKDGCKATAITRQGSDGGIKVLKEGKHTHPPEDDDDRESSAKDESECSTEDETSGEDDNKSEDATDDETSGEDSDDDEETDEEASSTSDEDDTVDWEAWHEESSAAGSGNEDDAMDIGEEGDGDDMKEIKLKRYKYILRALQEVQSPMREGIWSQADKGLVSFLCEICYNLLMGAMPLTKRERNILRPFAKQIRALADEDTSWRDKKESLVNSAHEPFIPVLLNVVWPYL